MLSKSIAILALSASAVMASPMQKRHDFRHHRFHGTGDFNLRPTGTGAPLPDRNDTEGLFPPPDANDQPVKVTQTVSPLPEVPTGFNKVVDGAQGSPSCNKDGVATETSTNFITVTGSGADTAQTKVAEVAAVSPGAFYGDRTRNWGGNSGYSSSAAAPVVPAPSADNPSTTFAIVPSASKGSDAQPSASVAASPPSGSSGGKRGISFNDAKLVKAFGNSVSWSYNWASTESGDLGGVEYVPMMWGRNDVSNFASKVGSATHVLGFNEPDLGEQANIDPQTAAKLHREGMSSLVGKVQIGSPSVTNGATTSPPMGVNWLDQFFTACGDNCPVDFVTYHWYATADSIEYFKTHTQQIINVAAKYGINKVWLTEFKPEGSASAQAAFMKEAVAFLEATPQIERYAAFMASEGTMLSGGSLNPVGSAYAGA